MAAELLEKLSLYVFLQCMFPPGIIVIIIAKALTDPIVRETDLTLTASETKLYLIPTICFSHKNHSGKKLAISGDFFVASRGYLAAERSFD